jgi:hypothetical protein
MLECEDGSKIHLFEELYYNKKLKRFEKEEEKAAISINFVSMLYYYPDENRYDNEWIPREWVQSRISLGNMSIVTDEAAIAEMILLGFL